MHPRDIHECTYLELYHYVVVMTGRENGRSHKGEIGQFVAPVVLAHEQPFQVGSAEFHPATREVIFGEGAHIIEPRVMQLLVALFRAGGSVVSKDALLQTVWGGRVVSDDAINRVVSRLRAVAEKEAGRQFRIETITKVGYRLLSSTSERLEAVGNPTLEANRAPNRWVARRASRPVVIVAIVVLFLSAITGVWLWRGYLPASAHSMNVRLAGFRSLSAGLPGTIREAINAGTTAAFNVDGAIGVSTASTSPSGSGPAYALDGTIERVGASIRVISRFSNERSRIVLWSSSTEYPADQVAKIPHKIAVEAGTVIRCGLSGTATYPRTLPDAVLSDYMRYCQEYWSEGGTRTLRFAQRVVAAVPDFSWGWSAVGNGFMQAANEEPNEQRAAALRAAGRQAEDKAIALDSMNSEALAHKSYLIDQHDWIGREALFSKAVAAKPLDCGCEHYGYGLLLSGAGRLEAAVEQFRAATEMLALWPDSQFALADLLAATGRTEDAAAYFHTAIDLSKQASVEKNIAVREGVETGDYDAALDALRDVHFQIPSDSRRAFLKGYEALASGDSSAKAKAVQMLLALPKARQSVIVANLLGALGANEAALEAASSKPWLFWRRSMRRVLDEPAFPSVAERLGLMSYWKTSHKKPDVCSTKSAPPFCQMI